MVRGEELEVVVVGGGPAGSITAGLLSEQGHSVRLLDRAEFPRPKPCGDSLNPGAVRELLELGLLNRVLELPHQKMTRWRIHPLEGGYFEGKFAADHFGIATDRAAFDGSLLKYAQEAGVEVETGVRVSDLLRERNRVAGVRTLDGRLIRARMVVGADGLRSVVVRRLGLLRRKPKLRKLALTARVVGARLPAEAGVLALYGWGCAGLAPLTPELTNVALVLDRKWAPAVGGNQERCFDQLLTDICYLEEAKRISAVMSTGPFDWPTRSVTADGALLVGDAAGYFDPFTGQGIFRALRGARYAATVASRCLRSGQLSKTDLAPYEQLHWSSFSSATRVQRMIEFGAAHPPLFGLASALLQARPALANRVIGITGDVRPLSGVFLPERGAPS